MSKLNFLFLSFMFGAVLFVGFMPIFVHAAVPTFSNVNIGGDSSSPYDVDTGIVNMTFQTQVNADCRRQSTDANWSSMFFDCSGGQGSTFHNCTPPATNWGAGTHTYHFSCRDVVTLQQNIASNNLSVTFTASDPPPPPKKVIELICAIKDCTLTEFVDRIINFLFTIAVILAPILLVIAGIIFMTSRGNPERISTGRRMLWWTVIGFLIILLSKGLVEVLKGIIGVA